jgi:hypothetical protein
VTRYSNGSRAEVLVRLGGDATVSNAPAVSALHAAVGASAEDASRAPAHGKRQRRHPNAGVANRALVFGELLIEQG